MEQLNIALIISYAVAVLVDIGAPILIAIYLARRLQASWRFWLYGFLVFLLFQGVTRVPLMLFIQTRPAVLEALKQPLFLWSFLMFAAFTAGLFEEGGRWLALRYVVRPDERTWRNALMFGAGHGGLEAIAVGLLALAGLISYLVVMLLPAETLPAAAAQLAEGKKQFTALQGWEPLMGAWERLMAMALQIALAVMVQQSFVRGARWWWYALAAHTIVDFTAIACLQLAGKAFGATTGMLLTEGLVTVFGLLALWYIRHSGKQDLESRQDLGPTAGDAQAGPQEQLPDEGGKDGKAEGA